MKIFEPKIVGALKEYNGKKAVSDIVAGIIVAIIALPLSIALAIASGVSPEQGLYTAIVAGFVIALFGGSNVNISGPTAAFATIVAGIVVQYGIGGLALATVMAGVILILMGLFRFGALIKFIPQTITTGFTAGIAVTIIIGQIKDFLGLTYTPGTPNVETPEKVEAVIKNIATFNWQALLVGGVSLLILIVWPKISKKIPGSLIAVLFGILAVRFLPFLSGVNTIGDLYQITSGLPPFTPPAFSFDAMKNLLPSAFTIAILAAIESLLSCVVSDGMIGDKHNSNTELIAGGLGNIASGFFGGIPATGAIARTAANVKNGGRSPVSGIVHALVLLLVLVVLMPMAGLIPMPTIAAILFMVAYNMSEWRRFVRITKTAPWTDILVLVLTFVLTVVFDLVVAIAVGMILTAFLFMKKMADAAVTREWTEEEEGERAKTLPKGVAVYEVAGPMFFAAAERFSAVSIRAGIHTVILHMRGVESLDISAMSGLEALHARAREAGVTMLFTHVNPAPYAVMQKTGFVGAVGEEHFFPHTADAIAHIKEDT